MLEKSDHDGGLDTTIAHRRGARSDWVRLGCVCRSGGDPAPGPGRLWYALVSSRPARPSASEPTIHFHR